MILLSTYCKGDGETDDAGGLREAIAAAATQAAGGHRAIIVGGETAVYKLGSGGGIELPRNLVGWIELRGEGCEFKLTEGCRRLFDVVRNGETKHDVVEHFVAQDFVVDAGTTVHHKEHSEHVLFGNFIDGTIQRYISVDSVIFRRFTVKNVYTHGADGTAVTKRGTILLRVKQDKVKAEEETQDFATNITVEDFSISGGLYGIDIGGESAAAGFPNVLVDKIRVDGKGGTIALPEPLTETIPSSNVEIGDDCIGGTCYVGNFYGRNANDPGVSIDCMTSALVENVVIEDAKNEGFFACSQGEPLRPKEARVTFRNCTFIRTRSSGNGRGFVAAAGDETGAGIAPRIYLENCWVYSSSSTVSSNRDGFQFEDANPEVSITGGGIAMANVLYSTAGTEVTPIFVRWAPTKAGGILRMRGLYTQLAGKREAAAGALKPTFLRVSGAASILDVEGLTIDNRLEGSSTGTEHIQIATGATEVEVRGRLNFTILADGDEAKAKGLFLYSGARINGELIISGDTRGMDGAEARSVVFDGALSEAVKAKAKQRNLIVKALPISPEAITVGVSAFVYRNLDGYAERVIVRGGTVSAIAITNLEIKPEEKGWEETGVTAGVFVLDQGDSIKVTYTVKPTMAKVPLL